MRRRSSLFLVVLFACAFPRGEESATEATPLSSVPTTLAGAGLVAPTSTTTPSSKPITGWQWDNPRPVGSVLQSIHGCAKNELYTVGIGGVILHSSDGTTWQRQESGTTEDLHAVRCVATSKAYAAGNNGTLLVTTDWGATWQRQESGTKELLFSLWSGSDDVYAVGTGGAILHKQGTSAWTLFTHPARTYFSSVWGDASGVYVAGDMGALLHASDDGKTWEQQSIPTKQWLRVITGDTAGNVYAMGHKGALFTTNNRGKTWTELKSDEMFGTLWVSQSLAGGPAEVLYASRANDPRIFVSVDKGRSWTGASSGVQLSSFGITSFWGSDSQDVYAVGNAGLILHTEDGGKSWATQIEGNLADLRDLWSDSAGNIYVVGRLGTILKSSDQGKTWQQKKSGVTSDLDGIWGDQGSIYVVGDSVLQSNDAGESWKPVLARVGFLRDIWGDADHLYVVGDNASIYRSADKGRTWEQRPVTLPRKEKKCTSKHLYAEGAVGTTYDCLEEPPPRLYSIWGTAKELYVGGGGGIILHSKDAGESWQQEKSGVTVDLYGIWGDSKGAVYAVGEKSTILKSTDRGKRWVQQQTSPYDNHLFAVWGGDASGEVRAAPAVYAVGYSYGVMRTKDGGATWTREALATYAGLYAIWQSAAGEIYTVGDGGTILHYWP